MFTIEAKNFFKFRASIVRAYKEQEGNFNVTFKCEDGDLHVNSLILLTMSDFYPEQLEAKQNHGNTLDFTYKYSKE